ncbi:hypothetical protein IAQ61_005280, partial [Plenodomus lingam]|uniref:uncharacterized protein n=1 Tax=Leptosphaeria maculans TaxID=5022 RepID=UPI003317F9EB
LPRPAGNLPQLKANLAVFSKCNQAACHPDTFRQWRITRKNLPGHFRPRTCGENAHASQHFAALQQALGRPLNSTRRGGRWAFGPNVEFQVTDFVTIALDSYTARDLVGNRRHLL